MSINIFEIESIKTVLENHGSKTDLEIFEKLLLKARRTAENKDVGDPVLVLEYLNRKRKMINSRNRGFRPNDKNNLKEIRARLKDGYTVKDMQTVIDHKCRKWKGGKMESYLQPKTLFCAKHFSQYLTEAESAGSPAGNKQDQELRELMG